MIGAICGDILGSTFEFENKKYTQNKEIPLFNKKDHFTDDTVLTLAVADWLMNDIEDCYFDDEKLKERLAIKVVEWVTRYRKPELAYGNSFIQWFFKAELMHVYKPYNSYGNGSAMRVSPVGWYFDSLEETLRFAKLSADITHNHPEGEKGAMCIASAIYLARTGKTKVEIKNYLLRNFKYDSLKLSFSELKDKHEWNCLCQSTIPQSIVAFLESTDYESSIRYAISYGGDADTMATITGSIAEAYYGRLPESLLEYCDDKLDDYIHNSYNTFIDRCKFYKIHLNKVT